MANIGNLAATLSLNPSNFTAGIKTGIDAIRDFETAAHRAAKVDPLRNLAMTSRPGMSSGRISSAMQAAAFGLDDFVQQTQSAGLQAGIRAAGNNVTMLASALGPLATVAAAAGVALANDLIPSIFKAGDAAAAAAHDFGGLNAALRAIEERGNLDLRIKGLETRDEATKIRTEAEDRMKIIDEQQAAAKAYRQQQEKIVEQYKQRIAPSQTAASVAAGMDTWTGGWSRATLDVAADYIARKSDPNLLPAYEAAQKALTDSIKSESKLADERLRLQNTAKAAAEAELKLPANEALKAAERANRDSESAIRRSKGAPTLAGFSLAGSVEAFSSINRSASVQQEDKAAKAAQKTADNTKSMDETLKEIAKNQGKIINF